MSFTEEVRNLRAGQTATRSIRTSVGVSGTEATTTLDRLKRTANPITSRLRKETGSEFRVETGSFVTSDNAAIISHVCVTRITDTSGRPEWHPGDLDDDGDI